MPPLDLTYPAVQALMAPQKRRHPTESRAFLAWVLESIYRLEEVDADDAVCDGPDDKGVDGLYVYEANQSIEVFQSKLFQNNSRTLGDGSLREFVGSLSQFRTRADVEALAASTQNKELVARIAELNLPKLIESGYSVRGIFVTNAAMDANGANFAARTPQLTVLDDTRIKERYVSSDRLAPETGDFEFDLSRFGYISLVTGQGINVVLAPIAAGELVRLPGIESGALFEPNLRQSLGRTQVNKEIAQSIETVGEHGQFLLYHNGITVVCEEAKIDAEAKKLRARNIFVVNGCQSISSLHDHKANITDELRLVVKFIEVRKDSELINKITHRSNNQNSIKARDFKANDKIQVRLQNEFREVFRGVYFYQIKRGEESGGAAQVIDNELAARLLLSYDLMQPWSAHQTYRLFDESYRDVFSRPEVNATRIKVAHAIYEEVLELLPTIKDQGFSAYKLSTFFLLYLVARALQTTEEGRRFWLNPTEWVSQPDGWKVLQLCVRRILADLIVDLNHELEERAAKQHPIDFKRELKSASAAQKLASEIISSYEKLVNRGRTPPFAEEWKAARGQIAISAIYKGGQEAGGVPAK